MVVLMAARVDGNAATGIDCEAGGSEFTPYEKMPEDTNCWETRKLKSIKKWVALEKIHGANLSFTAKPANEVGEAAGSEGCWVGVAKRGGYLRPDESFFGVRNQVGFLEGQEERTRAALAAIRRKHPDVTTVTVYGELFGGSFCTGVTVPGSSP